MTGLKINKSTSWAASVPDALRLVPLGDGVNFPGRTSAPNSGDRTAKLELLSRGPQARQNPAGQIAFVR